ncbi:TrkA family potassium uptake protein [Anabaena cylindrica FACHB-243]|uniref:TrkA-N domain protein n=1 Tax=Anabaena cylindrica (strain ATCC 27899 / PCC 7122) TaxID=272123 RepID=K9ZLV4_ANACC|nr:MULTISPECIES: TrkA family potassium uptake protein [Anabaena]AFZ59769.1 TrkA-N domain protein [Anabaena cylindrica PCC 7122]MBD2417173.1 TrkA family potassium uptake protein [Anabaena cylindrica FACHB-243]MBY5282257.1 TrkA family potassium uptake protein [Anabaena sp. CCAP 1446/1C]MBY5309412.1 TrkA family potassium uptake protein [Anabaena sp. CCAP 1446/1C]MCM2405011.1 TrkA family potassium uptake protein [Anabaena sp. CCAP 1446/1C]
MYVLIGGAGLVGLSLAQKLVELGHTVAIIDIDSTACRYAREQVGAMAFEGSAVSTEVLLEAGIRKANSLAAVLRSDALNLALVTLAKHYGVPHILSRMRHPDFAEPLRIVGANHIISTVELAVSTMVNAIEYPQVESMMHFDQGQIEVLKLSIPTNCYVVNRSVAEIAQDSRFPTGSLIIGYQPHPQEDLMIPNGSTVLEPGSTILIVTKPGCVHQVIDFIEGCENR